MMRDAYSESSSSRSSSYSESKIDDPENVAEIQSRLQQHTKLNIRRQLKELGYTSDVPDDVLEEFLESMQAKESQTSTAEMFDTTQSRVETGETSRVMQRLKKIDLNPLRNSIQNRESTYLHDYPVQSSSFKHDVMTSDTRASTPPPLEPINRPRRTLSTKLKKHDPVNRIHEMKRIWAKDVFLKRAGDLNTNAGKASVQAKMALGPTTTKTKKQSNKL